MGNTSPFDGAESGSSPGRTTMTKKKLEQIVSELCQTFNQTEINWLTLMEVVDSLDTRYSIIINPLSTGIFDREDKYAMVAYTTEKKPVSRQEALISALHNLINNSSFIEYWLRDRAA